MPQAKCQCKDTQCRCHGYCEHRAVVRMFRTDMEDIAGTTFCEMCGDDAFQTGLFMLEEIGVLGLPLHMIH